MRTTRQRSVTLRHEIADMVRAKVESGDYASESEVVREGLRAGHPRTCRRRVVAGAGRRRLRPAHGRPAHSRERLRRACAPRPSMRVGVDSLLQERPA